MDQSITDITPLTLLDYPGKTACILWSGGCNMRCRYCYNAELLQSNCRQDTCFPSVPKESSLANFLKARAGFLDGVVLSGGECSLNKHLPDICRLARSLDYAVKMDTNGSRPDVVRQLVSEGLVQYIALDYKAPRHLFNDITQCAGHVYDAFSRTLDWLISLNFPFEVRTTVHPDLLDEENINMIIDDLEQRGYGGTYYLQYYFHTDSTLGSLKQPVHHFDRSLLSDSIPTGFRNFEKLSLKTA